MSFKLVKQVIRSEQQSAAHKLVMIVIADHTNESKSGTAWPAVETIADYVGLSRRQVQRILRELEASGQLKVWKKNARMGTNRYQIVAENVSQMSPHSDTHVTPNVTFTTLQRDTHVTQVHKEHINKRAGGAPASGQGATALERTDPNGDSDAVGSGFAADAPKCETHPDIVIQCDTCYAYQVSIWRKEPA